ncbi:hypothetical protein ACIPL1_09835 [Pseudomonas sp. NPDC090202]
MSIREKLIVVTLVIGVTSLNGCAKDERFLPPADNEYVTVTVKVPSDFEADTMQVMYRSPLCTQNRGDSAGRSYEVDGFHSIEIQPSRLGETDLYQAKLAVNGGGQCQWRLSNVTFGVAFLKPAIFGATTFSGGGGVVVIFDNNDSSRGGADYHVDGDLEVVKDYYPWIDENFLGGYWKDLRMFG